MLGITFELYSQRHRFTDPNKLFTLCVSIQQYFKSIGAKTQVMPASLTSIEEIFCLAGVNHITIAPSLLEQLAQPGSGPTAQSLFNKDLSAIEVPAKVSFVNDHSSYRLAFSREQAGAGEEKLTQVNKWFSAT
jgi:transaldolase